MRRGLMFVLGLLVAAMTLAAVPAPVQARDLGRTLLGVITRPIGAILGAPRYSRRSYRQRRAATTSRSRAVQATPAQVQAARAATVAGAATAGTAAVAATAAGTSQAEAKTSTEVVAQPEKAAAPTEAQSVEAKPAPVATPAAVAAAPVTPAVTTAPLPAVSAPTVSAPAKAATAAIINESKAAPKPEAKPIEAKPTTPAPEAKPAAVTSESKPEPTPAAQAKAEPAPAPPAAAPLPVPAPVQRSAAVSPRSTDQPPARQQPTAAPAARGTLRSGVTGPLTWPTALEDVVGFAMWAGEYNERLRGHGIGDVLNAVMVPADALAARIRPSGVNVAARTDARRNAAPAAGGSPSGSLGVCNMEPAAEDWLVTSIERAIEPNAEQRAALTQLKTAFSEAAVRVRAACRDDGSPTSAERLGAMQSMLWAVHDATIQLRGPIAKFYGTLTAEQRQKFAGAPSTQQADPRSMTPQAIARLCGAPQSGDAMLRQAEQSLNLSRAQRLSLDTFQKKSAEMGQFLMASCLKPVASTPVERIDAAADRLTALIFAASTVNLALNDFYNQLSDEQRKKFDAAVR